MRLILLLAIAAQAQDPAGSYRFSGKYYDVTFSRSGAPPEMLGNVATKPTKATDGTGQVITSIPAWPAIQPTPVGYTVTAVPHVRPASVPLAKWPLRVPVCTVIDVRVYLASGQRPSFLQKYNPVGTPVFLPTPSWPVLVNVVCFGVSSTDTAVRVQ
jgi:hypothetical protein